MRTCPTCGATNRRQIVMLFGFQVCDLCLAACKHYLGVRSKAHDSREQPVAVAR